MVVGVSVVSVVAAVVVFALAAMWAVVGGLGIAQRLPGNKWFGVRSPETWQSEETFAVANRVAGPGLIAAAVILVMGGVLTLGIDSGWSVLFAVGALLVALFLVGTVSSYGIRAAEAVTAAAKQNSGGCSCCSDSGSGHEHGAAAEGASPSDDCGESSCGACTLRGMCTNESASTGGPVVG